MSEKSAQQDTNDLSDLLSIDFSQIEEVAHAFRQESEEILNELDDLILALEERPDDQDQVNILFRKVHTIKGSVGAVPGGQLLGSLSHEFEAILTRIKQEKHHVTKDCINLFLKSSRLMKVLAQSLYEKRDLYPEELSEVIELITSYGSFSFVAGEGAAPVARRPANAKDSDLNRDQGIWLSTEQMNSFLRLSGELLVLRNFFSLLSQTVDIRQNPDLFQKRQTEFSQELTKISDQLQVQLQAVRKERAGDCLQGLPVLIRQASTELNKPVQFNFQGEEILIDKALGHDLQECLVHMIRNSIDHGIEDQFERALQGKSSIGNLNLQIEESQSSYRIVYSDDGKGLDKERILQKALKAGLSTEEEATRLRDQDVFAFIFAAGFSTKEKITTISGRGVGMDIVHSLVRKYNGKIVVKSTPQQGTQFIIDIPIPKHIMVESSLICSWNGLQIGIPLSAISSIISCSELQVNYVDSVRYGQYKGLTVPLMTYSEICQQKVSNSNEAIPGQSALFIRSDGNYVGLLVDRVEAQTELVLKEFGSMILNQKGFQGLSVLADDRLVYVLDPEALVKLLGTNGAIDSEVAA
jgi:two-component system chemotaxis sensor kinase CheA